jgi:hypothetical protein
VVVVVVLLLLVLVVVMLMKDFQTISRGNGHLHNAQRNAELCLPNTSKEDLPEGLELHKFLDCENLEI